MKQSTVRASPPAGKLSGRDADALHLTVCTFLCNRGFPQFLLNYQGGAHTIDIAQGTTGIFAVSIRPVPRVHDGHQRIGSAHDGAYRTMAKQVGKAYGKQLVHNSFNRAVFSTFRMEWRVLHKPWMGSSWVYKSRSVAWLLLGAW